MNEPAHSNRALVLAATVCVTIMIAQHIAGKAARDALFLTYFAVERLPLMMIVAAVVSVAGVVLMSWLLNRFGPARLVPPTFGLSALLLLVLWQIIDAQPQVAAAALYLQVSAINGLLISGFWSVINERFDPYSAKPVIARLAAAATFGGLAGGVAAKVVSGAADTHALLLMLAGMHIVCALAVAYIGAGKGRGPAAQASSTKTGNLLSPLRSSSLIRLMALLALLVAVTAAILDYLLKAEAAASLSEEQLIAFFSYFYVAVGIGSFLLQAAAGNRALQWLGLGGCMLAWPLAILTTGVFTLLARTLVSVTILRASANLIYNSLFRTGFELLYTPIPAAEKRTGKVMIDVGADRAGDMIGAFLIMGLLLLPAAVSASALLVSALILATICLVMILVLQRNYSRQLAQNLKTGQAEPEDMQPVDPLTVRTLDLTQQVMHREALLQEIARRRQHAEAVAAAPAVAAREAAVEPPPPARAMAVPAGTDPVTESILLLRSGDDAAIRRILTSRELTPELVPHAISLLRRETVLQETLRALRPAARRSTGQLVDALLDPMQHAIVRRRLPVVLAYSDSPLAIHGLNAALRDGDLNVRYRTARALERIRRRRPRVVMPTDELHAVIEQELRAITRVRERGGAPLPDVAQRVEMIFLLLGAIDDPETVALTWNALRGDDRWMRGTALEYLENRLPVELWNSLKATLDASGEELARAYRAAGVDTGEAGSAASGPGPVGDTLTDDTSLNGIEKDEDGETSR